MNLSGQGAYFTQNTDFYMHNCSSLTCDKNGGFSGTTGVGHGLLSGLPGTCTPSVGYFATDSGRTGTLYQWSSTNNWTAYYTPYAYPHPLQ